MTMHAGQNALPFRSAIQCRHCRLPFAAEEATICACVTSRRTLGCPHCGRCACTSVPAEVRAHYARATPEELRRVAEERAREPMLRVVNDAELRRPLAVVADDDFDIRFVVKTHLEELGYGVIAVDNARAAWDAVQEYDPDLAVLDALMPGGDGRELSKRIKSERSLRTKTVVMTSLYTSAAQKSEAFRQFRVDAYLTKPVRPELLKRTLEAL